MIYENKDVCFDFYLYCSVQGFKTFWVILRNKGFSGEQGFCLSPEMMEIILKEIESNNNFKINNYDDIDSFISFTNLKDGKVLIKSFLKNDAYDIELKINLEVDQTIYQALKSEINSEIECF